MKYYVITSQTGQAWYIYKCEQKVCGIVLGMFPTGGECQDFAQKLCKLLNEELV